jgi:hypothetical protein
MQYQVCHVMHKLRIFAAAMCHPPMRCMPKQLNLCCTCLLRCRFGVWRRSTCHRQTAWTQQMTLKQQWPGGAGMVSHCCCRCTCPLRGCLLRVIAVTAASSSVTGLPDCSQCCIVNCSTLLRVHQWQVYTCVCGMPMACAGCHMLLWQSCTSLQRHPG